MEDEVGGSPVTNDYVTDIVGKLAPRWTRTTSAGIDNAVNKPILITRFQSCTGDITRVGVDKVMVKVRIYGVFSDGRNSINILEDALDQYGLLISLAWIVYGERFRLAIDVRFGSSRGPSYPASQQHYHCYRYC
jgi:hypothetical protein